MRNNAARLSVFLVHCLIAVFVMTGCGNAGYHQSVGDFQTASAVVIATSRTYLTELNKVERNNVIDNAVHGNDVAARKIHPDILRAKQVFSTDDIAVRLSALDQLQKYCELLQSLANSDAPDRMSAQAKELSDSLTKLAGTLNDSKIVSNAANARFLAASGVATSVFQVIATYVIEQKIDKALNDAITKGEKPVNELIAALKSDLSIAYERRRTALDKELEHAFDTYNAEAAKTDSNPKSLTPLAKTLSDTLDRYEAFPNSRPQDALDAMSAAHTALVQYARSEKKTKDFQQLVGEMNTFVTRAKLVADAIIALKKTFPNESKE